MRHIKKFNEAIIDYKSEGIDNFYHEVSQLLPITFERVVEIGERNGVEVVDYDTFYNELSDIDKTTAPPRNGVPVFALANDETGRPRVVFGDMFTKADAPPPPPPPGFRLPPNFRPPRGPMPITMREIDHIYHMLKHENIHLKQQAKRPGYTKPMPNPVNRGKYFTDTDEIMAFSQSIVDMLINTQRARNLKDAFDKLKNNHLYKDVKRYVTPEVLKKYHKYIYLYLEKEFPENVDTKVSLKDRIKNFLKK